MMLARAARKLAGPTRSLHLAGTNFASLMCQTRTYFNVDHDPRAPESKVVI